MLNVAIIGAGFFGEMHARALAELPEVRLVAASRTNPVALEEFARRFQVRGHQDYREVLKDPSIDIVVIATPHHLHTEIAIAAAEAGKHILLEKPMSITLDECDRIVAAVEAANVKLMVGHINQFARAYRVAKEIIDSGEVGEIVLGLSTMSKYWMEPNRRPWHLDRKTGGGMWLTAGMHCLDRLTWLIGSPVERVSAQFDTRFHDQAADDVGMAFVRYANGAMGTIVSTAYRVGAPKHLTELTCTKGTVNIEYTAGVSIGRGERWQPIPDSGSTDWMHEALINEWRDFLHALERNTDPPVSGRYARHIMAVAFAAEESSRKREEIEVPAYTRVWNRADDAGTSG